MLLSPTAEATAAAPRYARERARTLFQMERGVVVRLRAEDGRNSVEGREGPGWQHDDLAAVERGRPGEFADDVGDNATTPSYAAGRSPSPSPLMRAGKVVDSSTSKVSLSPRIALAPPA